MPTKTQDKKGKAPKLRLSKRAVKLALLHLDWTQADLANALGKSLTAVNLSINYGTCPEVTEAIRKELSL